jgi:hypothetical protein
MNDEPVNLAFRMREPAAAAVRQRSMVLHPAAFGGCILACLLAVSACGSSSAQSAATPVTAATARSACASGSAFALSLVSDRGGQPTPVAAAAWFARHGGVAGVPDRGWREAGRHGRGATVRSGRSRSTSSRDPTGHGRSTAAAGVPDACGTPVVRSGRQCVSTPIRARSAADPDVRTVKEAAIRAPRQGPDPIRNREAPRCGRA